MFLGISRNLRMGWSHKADQHPIAVARLRLSFRQVRLTGTIRRSLAALDFAIWDERWSRLFHLILDLLWQQWRGPVHLIVRTVDIGRHGGEYARMGEGERRYAQRRNAVIVRSSVVDPSAMIRMTCCTD